MARTKIAAVRGSTTVLELDGGLTGSWQAFSGGVLPSAFQGDLFAFPDSNIIFASLSGGGISHYNGTIWVAGTGSTPHQPPKIWGPNATNVWAADLSGLHFYNGTTWASVYTFLSSAGAWTNIHGTSTSDVWFVKAGSGGVDNIVRFDGSTYSNERPGGGGQTWQQKLVADIPGAFDRFRSVYAVSSTEVYFGAHKGLEGFDSHIYKWDGVNFTLHILLDWGVTPRGGGASGGNAMSISDMFVEGSSIYFSVNGAHLYKEPKDGSGGVPTVPLHSANNSNSRDEKMAHIPGTTLEIVRGSGDGASRGELWHTSNESTWVERGAGFLNYEGVAFFNPTPDTSGPVVDTNSPTGTGAALNGNISFSTKEVGGIGVDTATINVTVDDGTTVFNAIVNGVFQSGWDGVASAITANAFNGFDVVIDPVGNLVELLLHTVDVNVDDLLGNSTNFNWTFTTETDSASYSFTVEQITTLLSVTPIDYEIVRAVFTADMIATDPLAANDALNPSNYTFTGGFRTIEAKSVTAVSATTYDVTVDEMTNAASYLCVVSRNLSDTVGATIQDALDAGNTTADRSNFTGLGERPRITNVTNPSPGILLVEFSEIMLSDESLNSVSSYLVTGTGTAKALHVTSVTPSSREPTSVSLAFIGGGSLYSMSAFGLMDPAGNLVEPTSTFLFEVGSPSEDELLTGDQLFFETDLGAIQLQFNEFSARRIEDLMILRASSIGHEEQFRQIATALKDSGINRDETKLKLFKE
jgi:hypothetical protein